MEALRVRAALAAVALVLLPAVALAPTAAATHRCYTLGDYDVCRGIPGDELLDDLFEPQPASHRCYTLGSYQVCRYVPGDEVVEWAVQAVRALLP